MKYTNLKSAFILLAKFCQKIEMKKLEKSGNEVFWVVKFQLPKEEKKFYKSSNFYIQFQ
jgi:hypothetical protein